MKEHPQKKPFDKAPILADIMLIAIIFIVSSLFLFHWYRNKNSLVTNWPVVGMLPGLVRNLDRIFDFFTHDILDLSGGTFKFKGPWFASLDFVLTSNPMNVNYVLSKNFLNYEKGSEFREIFKPFGDGIVTSDSDSWKSQRKTLQLLMKNNKFAIYQDIIFRQVLEKSLIPVLEHVVNQGIEVDLEDVLQRFDFDNICLLALGFDPETLSASFPEVPSKVAFNDIEDALMYRYLMPVSCWKLLSWLQIGEEKRLSKALKIADHFLYGCISLKREKLSCKNSVEEDEFDLLTALLVEEEGEILRVAGKISDKFLRDTAFNFLAAGKDTISAGLSWFFWLIATHPHVETKILQEIKLNSPTSKDKNTIKFPTGDELYGFPYLHAALCETLRLYPPVPMNPKTAIQPDVLPSGDRVDQNSRILISFYSMGRMEEIWGKDCLEFKPERWISEHGDIVHIPTYKFTAFSAGPRTCLGKDMSFRQMKIVAINMLWNYQVEVVEGQPISPSKSITLHIDNGLKVRIKKRNG